MIAALGLNAAAYFDGGLTGTTGPQGYSDTKLNLVIGSGKLAFEPSLTSYSWDGQDTLRTYALRVAVEAEKYTLAGFAGATPEVGNYSNKFAGADITLSLTPGSGGHSRLAGPGSRGATRGGQGVTRIDVGVGLKHTIHTDGATDGETGQTEGSLFAGAKILMVNLAASYTGYKYSDTAAPVLGYVPGLNFALGVPPKSSVNVKLDLPGLPLVTPFISYTSTKYKVGGDSSAYLVGAYIDLSMVTANVGYQMFRAGTTKDNFITLGVGIKF